jgi:PHD/YefM family antitoxin component YafN of YafNO toxin-antitoxin module
MALLYSKGWIGEVSEADETSALRSDPARGEQLLRAAADVKAGQNVVTPDQIQFRREQ